VRDFVIDAEGNFQLAPGADESAWLAVSAIRHRVRRLPGGGEEIETLIKLVDKNPVAKLLGQHHDLLREAEKAEKAEPLPVGQFSPTAQRLAAGRQRLRPGGRLGRARHRGRRGCSPGGADTGK
jgi:hypothetical protein